MDVRLVTNALVVVELPIIISAIEAKAATRAATKAFVEVLFTVDRLVTVPFRELRLVIDPVPATREPVVIVVAVRFPIVALLELELVETMLDEVISEKLEEPTVILLNVVVPAVNVPETTKLPFVERFPDASVVKLVFSTHVPPFQ